ncbi:hypothetical protein MJO28_017935 [Puccinia striiformis f. sp. tritici]|uniref:Uncharacterized protein n=1 Tax=Puccinia striiformis TaxID=27350 RepID=A0A2S4V861_9BASI|nr:hypothetical protein MJO28_017935 [Puccinia striiformis f. sp. tritici]POW05687.1 hypothetical protein PSTT_09478 [Puccinia striiformis]
MRLNSSHLSVLLSMPDIGVIDSPMDRNSAQPHARRDDINNNNFPAPAEPTIEFYQLITSTTQAQGLDATLLHLLNETAATLTNQWCRRVYVQPTDPTLGSLLPLSLPNLYAQARILAHEGPSTRPFHPRYRHHASPSPIGFSNRPGHEYPIRPFGRTQREDSAYATSTEAHELVAAQVVQEETVLQGCRFMKEAFDIYFRVCGSIPFNTNVDTRDLRKMIAKRLYSDIMGHMDSVLGDVDSVELMFID